MTLHLVVPSGFTVRPSGGNVYDRTVRAGLVALGWDVVTHEVRDGLPDGLPDDLPDDLPDGALVLVDGLIASAGAERLLAELSRLRLVVLVHMPFETPLEGELLAAAAAVVTTSGWTRRWLLEHYRLDPARLHVVVPGVDVAAPAPGTDGGGELLCVATVAQGKGQDVLVAALARLRDLDWRCTMVGALDVDPDFADEVRKATADAGLTDRVVLAGALDHVDVLASYAASDLLVLPSRAETYGMVVTEALAHGLPVVATSVGGVPEAMGRGEDGSTPGLLVRPDDPGALAGALRRWLADPRPRRRLRRSAALRRLGLPTWGEATSELAAVLDRWR